MENMSSHPDGEICELFIFYYQPSEKDEELTETSLLVEEVNEILT